MKYLLDFISRELKRSPIVPSQNDLHKNLVKAIAWLQRAQAANSDHGLAASYSLFWSKWDYSSPETTGYTIPTLFDYARLVQNEDIRMAALKMADYELSIQLPEGGFPVFRRRYGSQRGVAFDTGQVIFGLISAYKETREEKYLLAAEKAGNWVVSQQSQSSGVWEDYHHLHSLQAIDARVCWALLCLAENLNVQTYHKAAHKNLEWILRQQLSNGWFQNCSFHPDIAPVTHSIAYVIEGLLESGLLLSDKRYLQAAKKSADMLMDNLSQTGYLAGAFNQDWKAIVSWSCLTGSLQMALVWMRLGELTGKSKYRQAAELAIRWVAATQYLDNAPNEILGAIAGSYPIYGNYMRLRYPNWAAKFFADSIMKLYS